MVQLIHVVPESWKKNFCIFFISWWTASGTIVSAFSWHPTQENRMLTISSSGWWKVMTSITSTLENVDNIIFFCFYSENFCIIYYLFFLYWIFSGLVQDCTIFERISVVSSVVHGKTYISLGRCEISWLLYFTDCSTTLSMFFLS